MNSLPPEYSFLKIAREDHNHWWCSCPFHDDRRPSFSINKEGDYAGHFRCWACGEHGSPRRFAKLTGQPQLDYGTRVATAIHDYVRRNTRTQKTSPIDFGALNQRCQSGINDGQVQYLAWQIGLSPESLVRLGIGFDGKAFTFPMFDVDGHVIGLRRRFTNSKKVCRRGSKLGLFVPARVDHVQQLLICEGESDLGAALTLGFNAIGRPGCRNCLDLIVEWLNRYHGQSIVIVADNDGPGQQGAKELAGKVLYICPEIRIVTPPAPFNDLRKWLAGGATTSAVIQLIGDTAPVPKKRIVSKWVPHHVYKGPFKKITTTLGV